MKSFFVLLTILMAGCVNLAEMTDAERTAYLDKQEDLQYDREEALYEAKLGYIEKAGACSSAGGFMIVPRLTASRIRSKASENKWEYLRAQCAKW